MKIKFWGVRGSLPTPLLSSQIEQKIKLALQTANINDITSETAIDKYISSLPFFVKGTYGGNTSCIEVRTKNNFFIIDAGSGLRNLGMDLMKQDFHKGSGEAQIFISHTHWDHIMGLPFFVPFFIPGNVFNFYSGFQDIEDRLKYQQEARHFPISMEYMSAEKHFIHLKEEKEYNINKDIISIKKVNHPGDAFAIRIKSGDSIFIYTSDAEFNLKIMDNIKEYIEFFKNADILVFDAQYTLKDSFDKMDFGHSSASISIDIADKSMVKKLYLFHHEPTYDDIKMNSVYEKALQYKKNMVRNKNLHVYIAIEGEEIFIKD